MNEIVNKMQRFSMLLLDIRISGARAKAAQIQNLCCLQEAIHQRPFYLMAGLAQTEELQQKMPGFTPAQFRPEIL
jgi:hypothetical protein